MLDKGIILKEAWRLYEQCMYKISLGRCIRVAEGNNLLDDKYNYLSKLDGLVAEYELDKIIGGEHDN